MHKSVYSKNVVCLISKEHLQQVVLQTFKIRSSVAIFVSQNKPKGHGNLPGNDKAKLTVMMSESV